jgi:3-phenylpropionate/trans-cinnamate dioxygenase ferredoxin reductase subunit
VRATRLDRSTKTVTTTGGTLAYDTLVVATGSSPIRLPGDGQQLTLRTREDAERLRAALRPGAHIVIIGAGWIGAEVATAALSAGCAVTCVEGGPGPHAGPFGPVVSARLAAMWEGVDLRTGTRVAEIGDAGVLLTDGTVLSADAIVVGVGARAELGWLANAELDADRSGLCVDAARRTSDPSVYAVGDVASRWSERLGVRVQSGHWDEAVNGAAAAAAAIMGSRAFGDDVPYFWSDQFGRKIQYVGQHGVHDKLIVRDHPTTDRWGAAWLDGAGRVTAHLSVSFPKAMVQARSAIADRRVVDPEAIVDLTVPL